MDISANVMEKEMRIWHSGAVSYVEGKVSEKEKIDAFIAKMKELYPIHFDCCLD